MMLSATQRTTVPAHIRAVGVASFGRDAAGSAELEQLCRLAINRGRRLRRLLEMRAPAIIVRNEKRMVRAAVTAFLEGQIRCDAETAAEVTTAAVPLPAS